MYVTKFLTRLFSGDEVNGYQISPHLDLFPLDSSGKILEELQL